MPVVIDYPFAIKTLSSIGVGCDYPNSGAFSPSATAITVGWAGVDDPTIRPTMRAHLRRVDDLAGHVVDLWTAHLPGPLWIAPASHWAYELHFGNAGWLPERLRAMGIDVALLSTRHDGSPIQFDPSDKPAARALVDDLLHRSVASDFTAAFPAHATTAMLHHHGQVWWRTTDAAVADGLRGAGEPFTSSGGR